MQALIAQGVRFSPAELLRNYLLSYVRARVPERAGKNLFCVSFTMPEWERSPQRLRHAAHAFAIEIAAESDCGVWLALDISKRFKEHLYGVALTERERRALVTRWIELSGASETGCRVVPVTGQKQAWGRDRTEKTLVQFSENLARVLHYGLKSLPPRYDMPLAERVIATGCMQEPWEWARETLVPATPPRTAAGRARLPVPGVRCCLHCGRRMPSKKRRHARWCSRSCRTLAYKDRSELRALLTVDELDAFEERAAILEFDAGESRPRAEQLAYEQQQRAVLPPVSSSPQPVRRFKGPL